MTTPKTEVMFGSRSTHRKTGDDGAAADVKVHGKYPRRYPITTHGMSALQVVAKVRALESRHAEKEQRVVDLQSAVGSEIQIGEETFRITDAIIRERGEDAELLVQIFRRRGDGWVRAGIITRVYRLLTHVPDVAGVQAIARTYAEGVVAKDAAQGELEAEVSRLMGG